MWHIINKEKISKIDFYEAILDELLGCKRINLFDIRVLSNHLETGYDETLAFFYEVLEKHFYLEIIEAIKETTHLLYEKITWVIHEIDNLKTLYNK